MDIDIAMNFYLLTGFKDGVTVDRLAHAPFSICLHARNTINSYLFDDVKTYKNNFILGSRLHATYLCVVLITQINWRNIMLYFQKPTKTYTQKPVNRCYN